MRADLFYKDCLTKCLFSRESISVIESIVATNGNESTDCKLFQLDHNDISCEIFDIVSSSEICNGSMVSIYHFGVVRLTIFSALSRLAVSANWHEIDQICPI